MKMNKAAGFLCIPQSNKTPFNIILLILFVCLHFINLVFVHRFSYFILLDIAITLGSVRATQSFIMQHICFLFQIISK